MKEKLALRTIYVVSAIVFAAVIVLFNLPRVENPPSWIPILPKLNAVINGLCSALLLISFVMIRKKRVDWHKRLNIAAFLLSCLFLVSYIVFHAFGVETRFPTDNPLRPFYLFVLLTHIVLAAVVLPLVLLSFYRGLTGQIDAHKKLTRWSMPIWLYVTISGVVVYLLISPHYTF